MKKRNAAEEYELVVPGVNRHNDFDGRMVGGGSSSPVGMVVGRLCAAELVPFTESPGPKIRQRMQL
jgi:hypothetical protein